MENKPSKAGVMRKKEVRMDKSEKESLVQSYVRAYNNFDIDGMVVLMHSS